LILIIGNEHDIKPHIKL